MPVEYFQIFPSGYYSNWNPLSTPPDRGDDAVTAGENMAHTDSLTWIRRPGLTKWSTEPFPDDDTPMGFFDYADANFNQHVIVDSLKTVKDITPTSSTVLFTKSGSGNRGAFAALAGTLYMSSNAIGGMIRKRITGSANKVWGIYPPKTVDFDLTSVTLTPTITATGGSGVTILIGWKYVFVYKDSSDGHLSSSSKLSESTGPQTATTITVSSYGTGQPRVDKVDIYRTFDGGSTLFYRGTVDNPGSGNLWTYSDSGTDLTLNFELVAPSENSNNAPPRGMTYLVVQNNRVWGILGNTLRSHLLLIDDGLLNGVPEECWPPELEFRFDAPTTALATTQGLVVFSRSGKVYLIRGSSVFDFDPKQIYDKISVMTQDSATQDGDIIYLFTGGRQVLQISTDGIKDISLPLSRADLADFDPLSAIITVHREGSKSNVYLSNGAGKTFCFNTNTGTWSPVWTSSMITTNVTHSTQTDVSEFNVLFGPSIGTNGYIWKLNPDIHSDDGNFFSGYLQFGSFIIAEPAHAASIKNVITESTSLATVSLLIQEISGAPVELTNVVGEPPILEDSLTLSSRTHYPQGIDVSLVCRHFQIRTAWPAVEDAAELLGLGFETEGSW